MDALIPIIWLLQAAAALPGDPVGNDKLKVLPPPCSGPSSGNDIVVCGRRGDSPYRLKPLPPMATRDHLLPDASFRLKNGGSISLHGDQAGLAGGVISNRAMVTLKVPF